MNYHNTTYGTFIKRLNRFVAEVNVNGMIEKVHVKNTGRLTQLLEENAEVLLEMSRDPKRKTKFSLVAVKKDTLWINVDSQAPNTIFHDALKKGNVKPFGKMDDIKREATYGESRFDFYFEKGNNKGFIEVKGVTLVENGIATFPDAPTKRGTKHVLELMDAMKEGYSAFVVFIVQRQDCHAFTPNAAMDLDFANRLHEAANAGVQVLAYKTDIDDKTWELGRSLPVYFS